MKALICTVDISFRKSFYWWHSPKSSFCSHTSSCQAPTAPVSIRTHQVSLNRWIKPSPRLVYYLSQEPNPGKFPWSNLYVTEVEESLFPCLTPTQPPTKCGRYLGAITKQTTKAERPGASMCCWRGFVQDWSSPAGHPGFPHLSSQWIFSKGGHQPGQKHESVSPF